MSERPPSRKIKLAPLLAIFACTAFLSACPSTGGVQPLADTTDAKMSQLVKSAVRAELDDRDKRLALETMMSELEELTSLEEILETLKGDPETAGFVELIESRKEIAVDDGLAKPVIEALKEALAEVEERAEADDD